MAAPVVVALTGEFVNLTTAHLQGRGVPVGVDEVREALMAAATFEKVANDPPDLFGGA